MRPSQDGRNYKTEPRPRIFISSVMDGYENFRDAARDGIRQAGCEAVRAEDFPAATASPRNSCLDGVRSADAVVLLLGQRYGFAGPSGLAVTEEEYEEARKNHKPILVFLEDGKVDAKQQQFVNKVQGYIDGHWRQVFRNSATLTDLVRGAVLAANLGGARPRENQVKARIEALLDRRPPEISDAVWLQIVWATALRFLLAAQITHWWSLTGHDLFLASTSINPKPKSNGSLGYSSAGSRNGPTGGRWQLSEAHDEPGGACQLPE